MPSAPFSKFGGLDALDTEKLLLKTQVNLEDAGDVARMEEGRTALKI